MGLNWVIITATRLAHSWNVLAQKFLTKVAQISVDFWAILKINTFQEKTSLVSFGELGGNFR